MKPTTRRLAVGLFATATAFALAACSPSTPTGTTNTSAPPPANTTTTTGAPAETTTSEPPAEAATAITVRGCTPENPLIPTNTNEVCGGNVLDATEAKLVRYNPDNAAPEMDVAASIDTTDSINWTVKLNQGYMFQDGTEVKAKNFVDAWNWGAKCGNGAGGTDLLNSFFFDPIKGFTDPDGDGCNSEDTMSGLAVVDDYTFTIETSEPTSNLVVRLGYTAFAPQPDAFFADTSDGKADFAKTPIAAGPYQIVAHTDTEMVLQKFAGYSGKYVGAVDQITFKIYNDLNAAYNDVVANNLDLTDVIPAGNLVGDLWKSDLTNSDGSARWGAKDTGVIQLVTFSPMDPQLKDNVELRKAISMAWDREAVTQTIFNGARVPATGWVSPVVDGYKEGQCTSCTYDPAKAKEMFDAAGGYDGTLLIWVNADGGHMPWAEATCNQLTESLGVQCAVQTTPDFATLRGMINAKDPKLTGMFRSGWQMDYPSIENFLAPIYATGASSNNSQYSNPEFDSLLQQAAAATDAATANSLYQQAEKLLDRDFPLMPQFYQQSQYGFSSKIKSVNMTPFSTFDFGSIVLN